MKSNEILLALALYYKGEWEQIYKAISTRSFPSDSEMEELVSSFKGNYITILDKDYPESLKQSYKPPFVLFYEGDLSLLKDCSKNVAIGMSKSHELKGQMTIVNQILDNENNFVYVLGDSNLMTTHQIIEIGNKTIGVLPYPLSQAKYKYNLVLSEYPENAELSESNYHARYRIMVGISSKTLIITCSKHSGTSMLAMFTLQANNDLLVVPTSVLEQELENNSLIASGAYVVYDKESFVYNAKGGY